VTDELKDVTRIGRRLVPTIPLTDPGFRYVPAFDTNIRKRFDGIRWNMARTGDVPFVVRVSPLVVDVVAKVPK